MVTDILKDFLDHFFKLQNAFEHPLDTGYITILVGVTIVIVISASLICKRRKKTDKISNHVAENNIKEEKIINNGLNRLWKRKAILSWAEQEGVHIIGLQETKLRRNQVVITESIHQEPVAETLDLNNVNMGEVTNESNNEESVDEGSELINEKMEWAKTQSINKDARDKAIDCYKRKMELYRSSEFFVIDKLKEEHSKYKEDALQQFVEEVQDKIIEENMDEVKQKIDRFYQQIIEQNQNQVENEKITVESVNKEAKDKALYLYIKNMKDFCQSGEYIIEENLKNGHTKYKQDALKLFGEKIQDKLIEDYNDILNQEIEAKYQELVHRNQEFYETEKARTESVNEEVEDNTKNLSTSGTQVDESEANDEETVSNYYDFYKQCISKVCDPEGQIFMSPTNLDLRQNECLEETISKFNSISKMDEETKKKYNNKLRKQIEVNFVKTKEQNKQIMDYLDKMKDNYQTIKKLKKNEDAKNKEINVLEERNKKSRKEKNEDLLTKIETLKKEQEIIKAERLQKENENKEIKINVEKNIRKRYAKDISDLMVDFGAVSALTSPGNSSTPSGFAAKLGALTKNASIKTNAKISELSSNVSNALSRNPSFKSKLEKFKNLTKRKSFHEEGKPLKEEPEIVED